MTDNRSRATDHTGSQPGPGSGHPSGRRITRRGFVKGAAGTALSVAALGVFAGPARTQSPTVDSLLQERIEEASSGPLRAVVVYNERPTQAQVAAVRETGVLVRTFSVLPMIGVEGTRDQLQRLVDLSGDAGQGIISVYSDRQLDYNLHESRPLVGADQVESDLGYTGRGVGVAVIDSGIDGLHPDLSYPEKTTQNVKFLGTNLFTGGSLYQEELSNTDTSSGHGTHVSGTAAGAGTASEGYYTGLAPEASLLGLGTGDAAFILYAVAAFDYVLANQDRYGTRVINNSYGTTGPYDPNDPINVASKMAHDAGMTVVFSAGNSGPANDTLNPYSVAPWVVGVAASEKDGQTLAEFSSRGVPGSERQRPTLTGPGVDIVASRAATGAFANGGAADFENVPSRYRLRYTTLSGTSMSAPHVSGTVALMKEANPDLSPDRIKQLLEQSASPMADYAPYEVGAGYLDAAAAVRAAESAGGAATDAA